MPGLVRITDQCLIIADRSIENRSICVYLGIIQLVICIWALSQHLSSLVVYDQILHCDFANTTSGLLSNLLFACDAIIFDIGLFHALWGIDSCVAEHLDGGYGRFMWCICHTLAVIAYLPIAACVRRPWPRLLWPMLIQQSAYGIGLLILSLAALPRILPTFMGEFSATPLFAIVVYLVGTALNFLLLYVYWHWYWWTESQWKRSKGSTIDVRPRPLIIGNDRTRIENRDASVALPNGDTPRHRQLPNGDTPRHRQQLPINYNHDHGCYINANPMTMSNRWIVTDNDDLDYTRRDEETSFIDYYHHRRRRWLPTPPPQLPTTRSSGQSPYYYHQRSQLLWSPPPSPITNTWTRDRYFV